MKCISCQNEIQDGLATCPVCGAIQQLNNGVQIQPVQPVQPVAPVAPAVPQQPVQPAVPQQPVQPAVPQAPGVPTPPVAPTASTVPPVGPAPQALGTVSQRDAIAQGIQSGNLVNGMYSADEVVNSKEHQNFVKEEKKSKKKKLIITCILLVLLIAASIGGFMFYKAQFQTANKRITAFFDVVNKEVSSEIKNDTFVKNNGDYKVNLSVTENDKQYELVTDGKFAYDLGHLIDITANVTSLKYGDQLIDKDPLNLELYLNDSRAYINLQNLYDKYIYVDFDSFTKLKQNISQNDIVYTVLFKQAIKDFGNTISLQSSTQKIEKSSINGKNANVVKMQLTSENRKNIMNRYFEMLSEDPVFLEQYTKLSGKDEKAAKEQIESLAKNMTFDSSLVVNAELHTGIFDSSFIGLKISLVKGDTTEVYIIKPITGGYSIKSTKNKDQVLDLKYTKTKGVTSTTRSTTHNLSGSIFDGKTARNINCSIEINENVVVDVKEVKVKDSVKITNLTEEDYGTIITNLDKYSKLKSIIAPEIDTYRTSLTMQDNCSPDMNCISTNETGDTTTTDTTTDTTVNTTDPNYGIPADEPISIGEG